MKHQIEILLLLASVILMAKAKLSSMEGLAHVVRAAKRSENDMTLKRALGFSQPHPLDFMRRSMLREKRRSLSTIIEEIKKTNRKIDQANVPCREYAEEVLPAKPTLYKVYTDMRAIQDRFMEESDPSAAKDILLVDMATYLTEHLWDIVEMGSEINPCMSKINMGKMMKLQAKMQELGAELAWT